MHSSRPSPCHWRYPKERQRPSHIGVKQNGNGRPLDCTKKVRLWGTSLDKICFGKTNSRPCIPTFSLYATVQETWTAECLQRRNPLSGKRFGSLTYNTVRGLGPFWLMIWVPFCWCFWVPETGIVKLPGDSIELKLLSADSAFKLIHKEVKMVCYGSSER